jgi:hypothetical protein
LSLPPPHHHHYHLCFTVIIIIIIIINVASAPSALQSSFHHPPPLPHHCTLRTLSTSSLSYLTIIIIISLHNPPHGHKLLHFIAVPPYVLSFSLGSPFDRTVCPPPQVTSFWSRCGRARGRLTKRRASPSPPAPAS